MEIEINNTTNIRIRASFHRLEISVQENKSKEIEMGNKGILSYSVCLAESKINEFLKDKVGVGKHKTQKCVRLIDILNVQELKIFQAALT